MTRAITSQYFEALIELCDFAIANSRFYQRTIKPPKTQDDFYSLPILTEDDIRHHVDPRGHGDLLTGPVNGSLLVSSSASTGVPKFVFREYKEQHRISQRLAEALTLAGMTHNDRIANMFPPGNLLGAWHGVQEAIERIGATALAIGSSISPDLQNRYIHCLQPTGYVGFPTNLLQLMELGIPPFQKVLCGGEGMNGNVRSHLEKVLSGPISLVYGSIECGIIGVQCHALRGSSQYHPFQEDMLIEVLDPATGVPAPDGEIIVTHLHRRLQPLIRYRLGDLGQWHDSPCPCGREGRRIELKGRISDTMTIVNGLNIRFESIESALAELSEFSGRVQLRVRKVESKDVLNIIVEAENLTAQIVTQAVLGKLPELQSQHQRGLVITTIVPRGGIAIEDYKTLRIVDERIKTQ